MMILQNVLFCYEEYGNEVVLEDLFIICCRHVTLLEAALCMTNLLKLHDNYSK